MSANIFGEKFYARGEPGWHHLGTVFPADRRISLVEAAKESGVAFDTKLVPVYAMVDGNLVDIPDRRAVVREPLDSEIGWTPLDVVGKNYKLVTNLQICETFDELSYIYPVETIGALGDGERFFAALDAGMVDIKGDPVHQFFSLYDAKNGRDATKIFYTPIRLQCENTLRLGLQVATLTLNVAHTMGNVKKLEKIAALALDMQQRITRVNELFTDMASTSLSLQDFKKALAMVYKDPKPIEDETVIDVTEEFFRMKETMQDHREAAELLYAQFNDEHPSLANTTWGAWNAIVELEDWKEGRGQGQFSSALFGERALVKQTAFSVLSGLK